MGNIFKNKSEEFLYKQSYLERRLQKEVMEDGIAYIPCKVSGIDDIISRFSVKGCESVDSEFMSYFMDFIEFIPQECPIVLEIHGPKFTEEEKKLIVETISADTDYNLGKTIESNKYHRKIFWFMTIGTIVTGCLVAPFEAWGGMPLEFYYVLFWLFADALVRYLFVEYEDYKNDKIRAGQLASVKVEFVEDEDGAQA